MQILQINEIWRAIPTYLGQYEASNLGRIRRIPHKTSRKYGFMIMTQKKDKNGYMRTGLKQNSHTVHRLVALAFLENKENKPQINHKNSIRHDNCVENLEWCTSGENMRHAIAAGRKPSLKGQRHGSAILKDADIPKIRQMLKYEKICKVAKIFGVGRNVIGEIGRGITWKHIK